MEPIGLKNKKKMRNTLFISFFVFSFLIGRIGYIQFIQGENLQVLAYEQQVQERAISAKRGKIYDSTEQYELALSSTAYTVSVNPTNINGNDKEKIAKAISNIFEQDYEKVLKKIKKNSSIETLVKKISKEEADELRGWLIDNNITTGVNIDEDSKRYYPYSNLASQVIGFCGGDNQGLDGVEAKYDDILSGQKGAITKTTDATGKEIGDDGETYNDAKEGKSIVLSIDMTIQAIVEKYLTEACIDNICTDGGNIVAMNPKTGDILAMATYPSYNLNEPYTINNAEMLANWDNIEQKEKTKALQGMWRNKRTYPFCSERTEGRGKDCLPDPFRLHIPCPPQYWRDFRKVQENPCLRTQQRPVRKLSPHPFPQGRHHQVQQGPGPAIPRERAQGRN